MDEPRAFSLVGATIERIDRPIPGLYALSLASSGVRRALLVAAGPPRTAAAIQLVPERPRGEPADAEVRGLREKLEGGRITRTFRTRRSLGFEVRRGDVVWWVDAGARGFSCAPPIEGTVPEGDALDVVLVEATASLVAEQMRALAEGARVSAIASLRKLREKLARRATAIESDLAKLARAEDEAAKMSVFVPLAARAKTGTTRLEATDWSTGEAKTVAITLDPSRPPREQIDQVFQRAKRLRSGAKVAEERRREADRATELVEKAIAALAEAEDAARVDAIVAKLARELPGDVRVPRKPVAKGGGKKAPAPRSLPYRKFASASGMPILVGKGASQNDELTVGIAKPGDLFLHAKGTPGAHVIVPGWSRQQHLDPQTLLDAATLAAHFSNERGETIVDVSYADRRHVRKRRGTPAGLVEVGNEKVIAVRIEKDRLERLLASEDR